MGSRRCSRGKSHVLSAQPIRQHSAVPPEVEEEQVLSARKAMEAKCLVEAYPVAGVTFEGRQELVKRLQPDQIVLLEKEPWNAYDPNAVRVRDLAGRVLGYIPRRGGANERFVYETEFGMVASMGPAKDSNTYGFRIYARPTVPALLLDPLPAGQTQRFANLTAAFGALWDTTLAKVLDRSGRLCEFTGLEPKPELPSVLMPQWRYNEPGRAVLLVQPVLACQALAAAKAKLEEGVAALSGASREAAAAGMQELLTTNEGRLFMEINGFGADDAVQYMELVRQRLQRLQAEEWRVEAGLL